MQISRRSLIGGSAAMAIAGTLPARAWAQDVPKPRPRLTPAEAMAKLVRGNDIFDKGKLRPYQTDKPFLEKLAEKQYPFATIVCCSDSRVGPEQIFQAGLGELFIVRNAGATAANAQAIGSIEYSVGVLDVSLVLVLGHSHCGAAHAATEVVALRPKVPDFPGSIAGMVAPLVPSADATHEGTPEGWTDRTTHDNVLRIRNALRAPSQPVLYPPLRDKKLEVHAAVYDMETGRVEFLGG
jgi:carbonic anhydrase